MLDLKIEFEVRYSWVGSQCSANPLDLRTSTSVAPRLKANGESTGWETFRTLSVQRKCADEPHVYKTAHLKMKVLSIQVVVHLFHVQQRHGRDYFSVDFGL
jgi:hypothetical protein